MDFDDLICWIKENGICLLLGILALIFLILFLLFGVVNRGGDTGSLIVCQQDLIDCSANLVEAQTSLNSQAVKISELQNAKSQLEGEVSYWWQEAQNKDNTIATMNETIQRLDDLIQRLTTEDVISPPQIVSTVSNQDMLVFLRKVFPNASFRGVEENTYQLTYYSEIQRFLEADNTNQMSLQRTGNYVFRLMGNFSRPGWENIPVGWVKTDNRFYFVFIVSEKNAMRIYSLDPANDQPQPFETDATAKFVLVG